MRAALFRPLEHHVLEEMRDTHLFASLVQRGRTHPGPERNRPYPRHMLGEYGQSIGQNGTTERRHLAIIAARTIPATASRATAPTIRAFTTRTLAVAPFTAGALGARLWFR